MLENEGWECPTVNKGDAVEVSSNPESMAGSCPGTVTHAIQQERMLVYDSEGVIRRTSRDASDETSPITVNIESRLE